MSAAKKTSDNGGVVIEARRAEDARISNRRLVFETICQKGPISRVEIGGVIGLKPQTISSITRELLDQGLITEAGRSSGLRGQPQIYLEPNARAGFSVGVHLDRNVCLLVVSDLKRDVLVRRQIACDTRLPKNTLARVAAELDSALAEADVPRDKVWGVGLVLPTFGSAVYDFDFSMPHWEAWRDVGFAEELQTLCGLPVLVENDATAAAIGERFHRGDTGTSTFVYFYVGQGTGAGLIIDGAPFKGAFGNAGEMGLLPVFGLDGSPVWPDQKTVDVLSMGGLAKACGVNETDLLPELVVRLHQVRDQRLMEWLKSASETLRDVTAVFEVLFDPEFIAVGGAMPRQIIQTLVDMAYPLRPTPAARRDRSKARLVAAELIEDAAVRGAAILPIFVNTSPNFRHLYIRQVTQDRRPFDR
ncbi:ROK family protein [Devosia sp.]|uniref:ROK family protein n=1 Tax=Devosia sp. TaxID=1871048 RepID=UPI003BACB09B